MTSSQSPGQSASTAKTLLGYALMLAAAGVVFAAIRTYGETLVAPPGAGLLKFGEAGTADKAETLLHVLLALAAVIATGRVLSRLFVYLRQPPVIGEVVAGIVLGPSLLGRVAPELAGYILPQSVAPYLSVIAQFGVVLYMFLVGLELNGSLLRNRAHSTVAISHASIVAPFVLGTALALWLYPRLSSDDVPFTTFALFLGVSMSVTAFPVLARILTDRGMSRTELGVVALTCAAMDDVTAWCLLALVVGVAQAKLNSVIAVAVLTLAYSVFMFVLVRPVAARLAALSEGRPVSTEITALVFVGMLLSAMTTERIGIHAIFGAFLFGAVIPHDSTIARDLTRKLGDLVTILLLPAFFAFTGMRTQIGLVSGAEAWLICALVILVATAGKFGGSLIAARLTGLGWRDSSSLGILMNTRGLMELIVLNIGLDLRVISPTLFAMLVIMALVTTMATTPVLQLLHPQRRESESDVPELVGNARS